MRQVDQAWWHMSALEVWHRTEVGDLGRQSPACAGHSASGVGGSHSRVSGDPDCGRICADFANIAGSDSGCGLLVRAQRLARARAPCVRARGLGKKP